MALEILGHVFTIRRSGTVGWARTTKAGRLRSVSGRIILRTSKTVLSVCPPSCSVFECVACVQEVHARWCHRFAINAEFTAEVTAPVAQISEDERPAHTMLVSLLNARVTAKCSHTMLVSHARVTAKGAQDRLQYNENELKLFITSQSGFLFNSGCFSKPEEGKIAIFLVLSEIGNIWGFNYNLTPCQVFQILFVQIT